MFAGYVCVSGCDGEKDTGWWADVGLDVVGLVLFLVGIRERKRRREEQEDDEY